MDQQRPRNIKGRFEKGQPPPTGARRKKGVPNKLTSDIRAGAIAGFARHGSNGRGEGGFAGFCFYLAKKHPKAAARIVEKLLPLNVNATGLGGPSINSIKIVSIPSGEYLSHEAIAQMYPQRTLDHAPQPVIEQAAQEIVSEPAPQLDAPKSELELTALKDKLLELGHEQLWELAKALNVRP